MVSRPTPRPTVSKISSDKLNSGEGGVSQAPNTAPKTVMAKVNTAIKSGKK
jgi:hypothetical protein